MNQISSSPTNQTSINNHSSKKYCCTLKMKKVTLIALPILFALIAIATTTCTAAPLAITIIAGSTSFIIAFALTILAIKKVKKINLQIIKDKTPLAYLEAGKKAPAPQVTNEKTSAISKEEQEEILEEELAKLEVLCNELWNNVQNELASLEKKLKEYLKIANENIKSITLFPMLFLSYHKGLLDPLPFEQELQNLPKTLDYLRKTYKKLSKKGSRHTRSSFQIDQFNKSLNNIVKIKDELSQKMEKMASDVKEYLIKNGEVENKDKTKTIPELIITKQSLNLISTRDTLRQTIDSLTNITKQAQSFILPILKMDTIDSNSLLNTTQ